MSLARYGFLPWVRQGISAQINEPDTLGDPLGKTGRPTVDVSLSLTGIRVGAQSATPITGPAENPSLSDKPVFKVIELIGPGDITGIKSTAIVKTEPLSGVATFEPNYLPYIEFYEEDFPWRYTPASANGGKLRPWLVLVVLEEGEFERRFFPGAPLSAITHGTRPLAFPPREETWAWAHVQVNRPLVGNDIPAALRAVVDDNPNLASARLLCPRRLKANTNYTAFLLPAFEQGRLAGLGAPADRIRSTDIQACSWADHPDDEFAQLWPVYFEWDFRTGDLADFEYLVRRIEARIIEDPVGRRPIDLQDAGYELSYRGSDGSEGEGGSLLLEGALQVTGAQEDDRRFDFLNATSAEEEFVNGLQTILNLNTDLQEGSVPAEEDDPIITPPLYGQWHANTFRADPVHPDFWFNELNLDPRNRVAAGLGTLVVRKNQDAFMDRAWEQAGQVLEARRRIQLDRFAAETGRKLQASYFEKMNEASFSAFSSSFHNRAQYVEDGTAGNATVLEVVRKRLVKPPDLQNLETTQHEQLAQKKTALSQAQADLVQILEDIDAKKVEIAATEQLMATLESEITALTQEIAAIQGQIEAKELDIQAKNGEIATKNQEIQALEEQLADETDEDAKAALEAQISQKRLELDDLNAELTTLNTELSDLQSQKQDKETELAEKQTALSNAEAELLQQQQQLAQLEQDQLDKEQEIRDLEADIRSITDIINRLTRLYLPTAALRQDYRKLARPNSPVFRRLGGTVSSEDPLKDLSTQLNAATESNIPESFNTKEWEDLNWGAALYADPPQDEALPEDPVVQEITTTTTIRGIIQADIQAAQAVNKRRQTFFRIQTSGTPQAAKAPKPLLTYPEFKEAMYAALAEISSELVLPNVQLIPMDTFSILEVNQRFIESYLIGLNHEMARELLWREYPTDQRGSYFRRFWDDLDNLASTAPPPDIELLTALDQPLGQNVPADREIPPPDPENPQVVFVIRSELLKKFPNALIYMQRAAWAEDKSQPRLLTTAKDEDHRKMPVFKASIYPEVSFYGFPVTVDVALGDEEDPGWFFVVQERPGEARFGMDISLENEGDTLNNITEWNDLAWPMVDTEENGFLTLAGQNAPGEAIPPKAGAGDRYTWALNGAHMAGILFQLPFMVAVHATDMIKLTD